MMALGSRTSFNFGFKIRTVYRVPYTYLRELSKVKSYRKTVSWQTIFEFGCAALESLYAKGYSIEAPKYEGNRNYNNSNTFNGSIIEDMKEWESKMNLKQAEVIEFCAWLYFEVHMTDKEKIFFNIHSLAFDIIPKSK